MKLNDDIVPSTVDEAVQMLYDALSADERARLLTIAPGLVHFTFGMYLRNNWSMWDRATPLNQDFQKRFKLFGHGDDLSGMIMTSLWTKVRGEDVAAAQAKEAEYYRQHWVKAGLNPETGEKILSANINP